MPGKTLVVSPTPALLNTVFTTIPKPKQTQVLGSGPGIGVGVASAFAVRGFTHVALVARNAERLAQDEDQVLDAIQERGYTCQTKTWACDLTDFDSLKKTLAEIETFGRLECVLFNAARVAGKPPLEEGTEDIEKDFRVSGGDVIWWCCGRV